MRDKTSALTFWIEYSRKSLRSTWEDSKIREACRQHSANKKTLPFCHSVTILGVWAPAGIMLWTLAPSWFVMRNFARLPIGIGFSPPCTNSKLPDHVSFVNGRAASRISLERMNQMQIFRPVCKPGIWLSVWISTRSNHPLGLCFWPQ